MGHVKNFAIQIAESLGLDPSTPAAIQAGEMALIEREREGLREFIERWAHTPVRDGVILVPIRMNIVTTLPAGTEVVEVLKAARSGFPHYAKDIQRMMEL